MGALVPVYDGERIVGHVRYNSDLDHWDGHNWSSGSAGRHLGIARLKSGRMVLIHGTQWQGERDTAEVVSDDEALQAILRHDPGELDRWPHLKALAAKTIDTEA